jgi:hypothetical protein
MDEPRRLPPTPNDPVSGDPAWRPSMGFLAVAAGIVAGVLCCFAAGWMSSSSAARPADDTAEAATPPLAGSPMGAPVLAAAAPGIALAAAPPAGPKTASRPAAAAAQRISQMRDPDGDLTPDLADYVNEGEQPTMAEVIDRLHAAGIQSGLGAYSPPGTRPPLVGLAVPEDFALPEGYVRHHQATDDGQPIEPILMVAPGRQFVDAAGRPVEMPKDRIVPPELAPPGLPLRRIVIPPPTEPGRRGS